MKRKLVVLPLLVVAVAVAVVWVTNAIEHESGLRLFGTIEARNVHVGSKVGGRITEVLVRPGASVKAGEVLVRFDDRELRAALDQARATIEKLEAGFRPEEIEEARAAAMQAKASYEELDHGYRKEQVEAARAEAEQARVELVRAERELRRVEELASGNVFSEQERDDAEAAWKTAGAALKAAQERFAELRDGYRPETIEAAQANWRRTEAVLALRVRGSRQEDIAFAQAQLEEAEARYEERAVTVPSDSVVEVLDVRPGDLVAPNAPIATLLETTQLYVQVYVPETRLGHVRLGERADVRVDSFPGESFPGVVERIQQRAEFLPRNVQTVAERVHQMFGVEVRIDNSGGQLRAGMAAEVDFEPGGQ